MAIDQPKVVKLTIILLFLLSGSLCICAFAAASQSYISPSYAEVGLNELWRVDTGESFSVVILALVSFVHVVTSHHLLFKAPFNEHHYGMLVGVTGFLAFSLFLQAVLFGQNSTIMKELQVHFKASGEIDPYYLLCSNANQTQCVGLPSSYDCVWVSSLNHCARKMHVQGHVQSKFDAVAAFSIITCIVNTLFVMMLWTWRQEFGMAYGQGISRGGNNFGQSNPLSVPPAFSSDAGNMASSSSGPENHQQEL